jgi:hypothetical protein
VVRIAGIKVHCRGTSVSSGRGKRTTVSYSERDVDGRLACQLSAENQAIWFFCCRTRALLAAGVPAADSVALRALFGGTSLMATSGDRRTGFQPDREWLWLSEQLDRELERNRTLDQLRKRQSVDGCCARKSDCFAWQRQYDCTGRIR